MTINVAIEKVDVDVTDNTVNVNRTSTDVRVVTVSPANNSTFLSLLDTPNVYDPGKVLISTSTGITYSGLSTSVIDHGALTGLLDDDHPQYHTDARGDARYWPLSTDLATQAELDIHAALTTSAHGGIVPSARTLTINGTTFDLSANRSWTISTGAALTVKEIDSSPSVASVATIRLPNGVLTDDGGGQVTLGNLILEGDSRLADARTPAGSAGGVLGGTYPNPTFAVDMATQAELDAAITAHLAADDPHPQYLTQTDADALYSVLGHTHTFASLTSKPTTLSGYGITDAVATSRTLTINGTAFDLSANRSWIVGDVSTGGSYDNPSWITSLAWGKITGTPTTLGGYGITDAQPLDSDLTSIAALSTTSYGRSLLTLADAAAGRTSLGLGTASTHPVDDFALLVSPNNFTLGPNLFKAGADDNVALAIRRNSSGSTANVFEVQDESGTAKAAISALFGATIRGDSAFGPDAIVDQFDPYGTRQRNIISLKQVLSSADMNFTGEPFNVGSNGAIFAYIRAEPTADVLTAYPYALSFTTEFTGPYHYVYGVGAYGSAAYDGDGGGVVDQFVGVGAGVNINGDGTLTLAYSYYGGFQRNGSGNLGVYIGFFGDIDNYSDSTPADSYKGMELWFGQYSTLYANEVVGIHVHDVTGVIGPTTPYALLTDGGHVRHKAGAATVVPLSLQRAASQTADMLRLLDSDGSTKLTYFDSAGDLFLPTKSANTVYAGPTSGSAARPTWRTLVAADMPDLSGTYQPLDSDLTAIAALATASYGRSLLTLASASAGRTSLGLGSAATANTGDFEAALGNPASNGYVLSSTTGGVRSWVAAGSGSGTVTSIDITAPAAGITATGGPITTNGSITLALANDLSALEGLSSTGLAARTATDTWAQRTITGTSNRLSVSNGNGVSGNPTLDIDSAYVGQATITTLGTIATGTWQGGIVGATYGGTGVNNAGTITNASNMTITGGGTLALGGFTLTVPATGSAALLATANTFTAAQSISLDDSATNTTSTILTIDHSSSGTVAASFGSRTLFTLESTTTAQVSAGQIDASWATATHASRKARMTLTVFDTAAREWLRGEASGSAAMIGFLGASAVVRQTSGANLTNNVTSGGSDDTIADFTDLIVYANDAATIRNDIYQLARQLKQVNDALRSYGLLT